MYIYIYIHTYFTKAGWRSIYTVMKTMCPPCYHHNGFVVTHALGHVMYGCTLLVPINQRVLNKLSKERIISDNNRGDNGECILFS